MKLYTSRDFLFREYTQRRKTAKQIAKEQKVSEATITRWLTKYGLIRNARDLGRER